MNSVELERSLRTEFENYLKDFLAIKREEVAEFRQKIQVEFEQHKAQLDRSFEDFCGRFEAHGEIDDPVFRESVKEHLRLARDEGAEVAANAFAEAEKLREETAPPPVKFDEIRDAITEISSKNSQSKILQSLIKHAEKYAPRGAFFILKNEQFTGWKVFGGEANTDEYKVREISVSTDAETVLSEAVRSLNTASGSFADDSAYLQPLGFGQPDRMHAIPLVARGRGVAVLYADYGNEGVSVNVEALESLVRVAGLTVELLAASSPMQQETEASAAAPVEHYEEGPQSEEAASFDSPAFEDYAVEEPEVQSPVTEFESYEIHTESEPEKPVVFEEVPAGSKDYSWGEPVGEYQFEDVAAPQEEIRSYEPAAEPEPDYSFDRTDYELVVPVTEIIEDAPEMNNGQSQAFAPEPVVEIATAQPLRSRLSDRKIELPIDVNEEERRLHNDARRFARLLVSEIKLYNEQKVKEGRESGDLYERLREAIDRSREMYEKRVQPAVAAKFDYFHYELVCSLAEGEEARLGGSYPGASI